MMMMIITIIILIIIIIIFASVRACQQSAGLSSNYTQIKLSKYSYTLRASSGQHDSTSRGLFSTTELSLKIQ